MNNNIKQVHCRSCKKNIDKKPTNKGRQRKYCSQKCYFEHLEAKRKAHVKKAKEKQAFLLKIAGSASFVSLIVLFFVWRSLIQFAGAVFPTLTSTLSALVLLGSGVCVVWYVYRK